MVRNAAGDDNAEKALYQQADDPPRLFDDGDWRAEWRGMPEFVQPKQQPYAVITVRLRDADDLAEFAMRMEQPLTAKTKAIWFPPLAWGDDGGQRYRECP